MVLMKNALITGITGQDGSYLAEFLLEKGYDVHGIIRRNSTTDPTDRIKQLLDNPNIHLHYGDLSDFSNLTSLIQQTQPDEIYNLAAQSHVKVSFQIPYILQTLMHLELQDFLKQFVFLEWKKRQDFIRHLLQKCLVKFKKLLRKKQHHFIQDLLMVLLNFMDIGWLETTENHTISFVMEFFSIMNLQEEVNYL